MKNLHNNGQASKQLRHKISLKSILFSGLIGFNCICMSNANTLPQSTGTAESSFFKNSPNTILTNIYNALLQGKTIKIPNDSIYYNSLYTALNPLKSTDRNNDSIYIDISKFCDPCIYTKLLRSIRPKDILLLHYSEKNCSIYREPQLYSYHKNRSTNFSPRQKLISVLSQYTLNEEIFYNYIKNLFSLNSDNQHKEEITLQNILIKLKELRSSTNCEEQERAFIDLFIKKANDNHQELESNNTQLLFYNLHNEIINSDTELRDAFYSISRKISIEEFCEEMQKCIDEIHAKSSKESNFIDTFIVTKLPGSNDLKIIFSHNSNISVNDTSLEIRQQQQGDSCFKQINTPRTTLLFAYSKNETLHQKLNKK